MNKIQKMARELPEAKELVRFSISLMQSDNSRLEECAEMKGKSKSAFCSELLIAALDVFEEAWTSPDGSSNDFCPPTADKYVQAFQAIDDQLSPGHRAFLKAHYQAPQHKSTASELALAAGYQNYRGYNIQSAKIGQLLAPHLDISIPKRLDGTSFPSAVLVQWEKVENYWYCTLHPEVAKALKMVGLVD
jgi:hypothetical protein